MAQEVASGYVSLYPKLSGDFKSQVSNGVGSAGTEAGGKFNLNFGNMLKNIAGLAVVQKAASAVADTFSKAFTGAAEFEQLAGGVEKIFGDAMSPQIMADANNAWRTLNMSANDYLAVVNDVGAMFKASMGEQAGYDAATRGLQAISDYASGTGKDLDMLTEKFTLITRSTGSYQSIADQFSGILPATSADFLEQAQAAGFLSEEYQKLTDVPIAEYQQALTQMLEKGTAELGLAGNTAAETMDTMSGSMAGFNSAWNNLLVSLSTGGENMYQQLENVAQMGAAVMQNGIKLVGSILSNIGTLIKMNASPMVANAISYFAGFVKAAAQELPTILPEILQTLEVIGMTIISHAPELLDAGLQLIQGLVDAFPAMVPVILDTAWAMLTTLPGRIASFMPQMRTAGMNLIKGLVNGIGAGASWVVNKVRELCNGALDAVRNFFGIQSPSRLMYEMGGYISEGMALGITAGGSDVVRAANALNAGVMGSIGGSVAYTSTLSGGGMASEMASMRSQIEGLRVYIDGKTLVGAIISEVDAQQDKRNARRGRMVAV